MTRDEAIAHVRRLCPPGTLEALGRPSGGHTIAAVELRSQSTRVDPRAEPEVGSAMPKTGSDLEGPPTRRERRISEQVERVTRKPASGHFQAATRILKEEP